jgi:hypothetical protein
MVRQPHIVEAVSNHTVKGVAGVYNRAKHEAAKRDAMERLAALLQEIVQ